MILLVASAAPAFGRWWKPTIAISLFAVVAVGWFGSAKWLMFPALLGGLMLLPLHLNTGKWSRLSRFTAATGAVASAFFCWLFPMPVMPNHSGGHAVGTTTIELPIENGRPALMVQIWYPSLPDPAARRAPWLSDPGLAPSFPFGRISSALSGALETPKPAASQGKFKVLFYEHAWMGHRGENLFQVEDLASEGFVVVAIDHPGQSRRILHPDGSVVKGTLPESPDFSTKEAVEAFEKLAEKCLDARGEDLRRVRQSLAFGIIPELAGRLDLDRLGIFGFSFGGTTAIRECAVDPAFKAGANLDGFFLGDASPRGPFLFMDEEMPGWLLQAARSEESEEQVLIRSSEARIQKALKERDRDRLILDGTRHESFTDRIFVSALPRIARAGKRPSQEVRLLIHNRLSGFFKKALAAE